ncbi:MAG: DUF2484 family protein [Albidovulum sp.]
MSWPLLAAAIWALAATFTAFLPMRLQYPPGITLLILAPVILIWIGVTHGVFWALLGSVGFVSMFRKPLIYFARKTFSGRSSRDPKS